MRLLLIMNHHQQYTTSVGALAELLGAELAGDGAREIIGVCSLEEPTEHGVAFSQSAAFTKYIPKLLDANLGALLAPLAAKQLPIPSSLNLLFVDDPYAALRKVTALFHPPTEPSREISPHAEVARDAKIGDRVSIGAFCSIAAGAEIGDDTVLYPNVVLYPHAKVGARTIIHSGVAIREKCTVGNDCIIHNGSVIGADGFGYVPTESGELAKIPQVGVVHIGNNVEIGANSCIDRAALGSTRIDDGTKIDNQVQVGHNVKVGKHSILCAQVGIGGSAHLHNHVVIGAQTGIRDHTTISSKIRVAARSGVVDNLTTSEDYAGFPAVPIALWRRQIAAIKKLPETLKKLRRK